MITENKINELLLDQLYRLEGVLGKYNCQHGGMDCEFQTNCHRLIRAEIDKIKKSEKVIINCDDCLIYSSCEYAGLGITECKHFKKE